MKKIVQFSMISLSIFQSISLMAEEKSLSLEPIPYTVEARFSYAWFESSFVREVYGNGALDYQLTGTIPVYQGDCFSLRGLNVWWGADYIETTGHSIGLHNQTRLKMEPVTLGLKWISPSFWIRPFFGAGLKYYFLQVHNSSSYVEKTIARNGPGFVAETGFQIFLCKYLLADLFCSYSFKQFGSSSSKRDNVTSTWLDVGGLNVGGGLGFKF